MTTRELIDYVEGELRKGEQKDAVKVRLLQNGWGSADIEETLGIVEGKTSGAENIPAAIIRGQKSIQNFKKKLYDFLFGVVGAAIIVRTIMTLKPFLEIEEDYYLSGFDFVILGLIFVTTVIIIGAGLYFVFRRRYYVIAGLLLTTLLGLLIAPHVPVWVVLEVVFIFLLSLNFIFFFLLFFYSLGKKIYRNSKEKLYDFLWGTLMAVSFYILILGSLLSIEPYMTRPQISEHYFRYLFFGSFILLFIFSISNIIYLGFKRKWIMIGILLAFLLSLIFLFALFLFVVAAH